MINKISFGIKTVPFFTYKGTPVLIRIIAALWLIAGIFALILGVSFLLFTVILWKTYTVEGIPYGLGSLAIIFTFPLGIFLLLTGAFSTVIVYGLIYFKKWTLILLTVTLPFSLIGIWTAVFSTIFLIYCWKSKELFGIKSFRPLLISLIIGLSPIIIGINLLFFRKTKMEHQELDTKEMTELLKEVESQCQIKIGPEKDFCYVEVVRTIKDERICEKIKFYKDYERENCYYVVAKAKEDIKLCEKAGSYRDFCYEDIAKIKQNEMICEKIIDNSTKNFCITGIAEIKKDELLCEKLKGDSKDNCYSRVAVSRADVKLCEKSKFYKDNCYREIAKIKKDPMLCEEINETLEKSICYFELAKILKDETLCEKLSKEGPANKAYPNKENCYKEVQEEKF